MDDPTMLVMDPPPAREEKPVFDLTDLITEDDEPVDNFLSAKQQRLLVEPLYTSAQLPRPFLVDSNVAIYASPRAAAIVPDMFLSLGVQVVPEWREKENRSYLLWEFGKPPEVVVEIVSNQKGNEIGQKLADYAELGVLYYVIYDPHEYLFEDQIRVYQRVAGDYLLRPDYRLAEVGLSLTLWYGTFEDITRIWLRWCDASGRVIFTGAERAAQADRRAEQADRRAEQAQQQAQQAHQLAETERQRAADAHQQAETERQRTEQAQQRASRLAAQLRAAGIEPENGDEKHP